MIDAMNLFSILNSFPIKVHHPITRTLLFGNYNLNLHYNAADWLGIFIRTSVSFVFVSKTILTRN